jgi:hypothetical protein
MYQIQMKADDNNSGDAQMGVDISRAAIMEYQFRVCILDHNLEDETDRKLDFKQARDVHLLDSNIGQEINDVLENMHNWKKQFPNSGQPSGNVSSMNGEREMAKTSAGTAKLPITSSE